jgi:t-SNARE complex subunit (syntaxin)
MAEPDEQLQELIPTTEAAQDDETAEQHEAEKPAEDVGWVESPHAADVDAEQQDQVPEQPLLEEPLAEQPEEPEQLEQLEQLEQPEQPEEPTEEMETTALDASTEVVAEETPEEPAGDEPPAADIDEPAVLEPEPEAEDTETEPLTDMQALEQNLTHFRHCIENIGTQLDDDMNRQDMRKLRADIREKATRMENDLKDRQRTKDQLEPQERVHLQRIIKQLERQLNTYHELLERERAMTRRYPLVGTGAVGVEDDDTRRPADQAATPGQAQAMLKNSAREREQEHVELMELERDILGLQDIQTDVAKLIGEQADDVKLIEQNVERAGDRVEHGHSQMKQSVVYSRSSRKMMCVVGTIVACIAALLIIVAVIVLAVILERRG